MDNLDKYFQKIIGQIKDLIQTEKLDDALEIVEQELSSSYIPLKFIQIFEQLYFDISNGILVKNIEQKFNDMSKNEMLGSIFKKDKIDLNILSFFLSKFNREINKNDLFYLNRIFEDEYISNNEKIFILSQFKIANISYDFDFANHMISERFKINTLSNFEINSRTYYKSVLDMLEQQLIKEPSLIALAKNLLQIIYEHFFNRDVIKYNDKILSNNLVNYTKKHFDETVSVDKNFEL
jgi:hypothetical protein